VFAIPSSDAQARSILALAVFIAAWIAELRVAQLAVPALVTLTLVINATSMEATINVAEFLRAVVTAVLDLAQTTLRVRIKLAVIRAVGQARNRVLILKRAVNTSPTLFADASSFRAVAVTGTCRMRAVNLFAELSFVAQHARTLAGNAVTVSVTIRNFTLVVCQLTFASFPARIADAFAVDVVASLRAQNWTNA